MPRIFNTLVDAATLRAHLDDSRWVIVDCRWALADPRAGERHYLEGHIRGARYADLEGQLSGPVSATSGRHPLPDSVALAATLGHWGIGTDTQVVAYDDAGGVFAARLWWLLRWLGHDAVAVLDGGVNGWLALGEHLVSGESDIEPRHFRGEPDDQRWLDTEELLDRLRIDEFALFDARGAARYSGAEEPIDPVAGHIPAAINAPYTGNLGANGNFLAVPELRARFAALLAGRRAADAAVYCGSGVTACHDLLALEHAGLGGARLYAGSWSEWIRDPNRPVRTGGSP